MPKSFRDLVAYGDLILSGFKEGVLLRVGKDSKVEGALVTNAEVATGAAIADSKIDFAIPARISVTYAMNWATHAASGDPISYRKFSNKIVQLSGVAAKNIAIIGSDLIFTLPTGHRPDKLVRFVIYGASSTGTLVSAFLTINALGEVRLQAGATAPSQYIAIPDNCFFMAA